MVVTCTIPSSVLHSKNVWLETEIIRQNKPVLATEGGFLIVAYMWYCFSNMDVYINYRPRSINVTRLPNYLDEIFQTKRVSELESVTMQNWINN